MAGPIFGILSNNCIWRYINLMKFKVLLYNLQCGLCAQDCGVTIAFTATQALNRRQECRIVSLDINGAFDRIWWNGLLNHLWSIGFRQRAYSLMESYLSDRYLFVVANGQDS